MDKVVTLYGGAITIKFVESNHSYWLVPSTGPQKRLTGVTSFTGKVFDKSDNLIGWALDLTGDYLMANKDALRKKNGDMAAILEEAKKASEDEKKRASEIGKAVHAWIEAHAQGHKPDMPTDPKVLNGVLGFVQWAEENKVEFLWTERLVYSKKYGYVGTADTGLKFKAGPLKGKVVLGDYKVSNGLYLPVRMQTAAYQCAITEEAPKEKFDGRMAIRISAETEDEYNARMGKKWERRGYKVAIPPYRTFEAKFFPAEMYSHDQKAAMMAWELIQYQREGEKEMRG